LVIGAGAIFHCAPQIGFQNALNFRLPAGTLPAYRSKNGTIKITPFLSIFLLLIAGVGAAFRLDYNEIYPSHDIHA
jgi:hypothetical protein